MKAAYRKIVTIGSAAACPFVSSCAAVADPKDLFGKSRKGNLL
jgi:hypothetical protein